MKNQKKIAVIGAGVSGLCAGIYGRINGFDVSIFEMGQKTGGVCTSWTRQGYHVNGSTQWLVGSAPGIDFYKMWADLGVLENTDFIYHDSFIECRNIDGVDVHFYTEPNQLQKHLIGISPMDSRPIVELVHHIKLLADANFTMDRSMAILHAGNWSEKFITNTPAVQVLGKYNQISVRDFAKTFKSKVLKKAFESLWSSDMSMSYLLLQLSYAANKISGYPVGGSGALVEKLTKRFINLGGNLKFGQKISKILAENKKVMGIETENSESHLSDYVISACDGSTVLFKLLDKKFIDPSTLDAYRSLRTFPSLIFFSAGVNRTFEEVPSSILGLNIPLVKKIKFGTLSRDRATFQIYNFDPTLSPKGKTLITAAIETDTEFWQKSLADGEASYLKDKDRIVSVLLQSLEIQFPGITADLEFKDLATPITFEKWTGNLNGSYRGWLPTPSASKTKISNHFDFLQGFYMAGHWVTPGGGLPQAALSGRNAIADICTRENISMEGIGQ